MLDISGKWQITYKDSKSGEEITGDIQLPGIMQASGYGDLVTSQTCWVSSLHDPDISLWDEFPDSANVPFLSAPDRHFLGIAEYSRQIDITSKDSYVLFIELTKFTSKLYIDGQYVGEDFSVCTSHVIDAGDLEAGSHKITIQIDNTTPDGYRPDGHGVSDALGATWNGLVGTIALYTKREYEDLIRNRSIYAESHPVSVLIKNHNFYINGKAVYLRGTHLGGDFPITGYPETSVDYWHDIFSRIMDYGFNFVRFHSFCPPDAAFIAADELGLWLQPECGMWNDFCEGIPMLHTLDMETRRILKQFGHHPSFAFFSPTNEPSGDWYKVLRDWVSKTKYYDESLGYNGRRAYTAQSGWYYDTSPCETSGTDYLYFHRSAFGPYLGGMIRNHYGWKGSNYSPSLTGCELPVICHEMGQWCAYPDFTVIDKFTGYLKPTNFRAYKELARRAGLLTYNQEFAYASGQNQLRLCKEDFEANLRTPELNGYEMLDIHDYLGQGTALVGILDAFYDPKSYVSKEYFRQFNNEIVPLALFKSYVIEQGTVIHVPIEVSNYSAKSLRNANLTITIYEEASKRKIDEAKFVVSAKAGALTRVLTYVMKAPKQPKPQIITLSVKIGDKYSNSWTLWTYPADGLKPLTHQSTATTFEEALQQLDEGRDVLFLPCLSELGYDCVTPDMKNTFWNSLMGPTWGRNTGVIIDTESGAFDDFVTDKSGGWQWEKIYQNTRGMVIPPAFTPLLRYIDDWGRDIPLAGILEAKVGRGRMLMMPLDTGSLSIPEVRILLNSLIRYMTSDKFDPKQSLSVSELEAMHFDVNKMGTLIQSITAQDGTSTEHLMALAESNPNTKASLWKDSPHEVDPSLTFAIDLRKEIIISGFIWLNDQHARIRSNFAKEIRVQISDDHGHEFTKSFHLKCTSKEQRLLLVGDDQKAALHVTASRIIVTVTQLFGRSEVPYYDENQDGWHLTTKHKENRCDISKFHIITSEIVQPSNEHFWEKGKGTTTKEIEA